MKWHRQDDGSYTSEAGRVWREQRDDLPKSWRIWRYEPSAPTVASCSANSLAGAKQYCEEAYRAHQLATMPPPPAGEILRCAIEQEAGKLAPDRIRLEALRACRYLTGLPPSLAEALVDHWRAEQARERRRLGL